MQDKLCKDLETYQKEVGEIYTPKFSFCLLESSSLITLRLQDNLGAGQFGQVCRGIWKFSGQSLEVALKTLKPGAKEEDKVKFLQEAAIMGQFNHPNVVTLFGVITMGEPVSDSNHI